MEDTESSRMKPAAVGLRAHSGWASLVAVSGLLNSSQAGRTLPSSCIPRVIIRRRLSLAHPGSSPQPYHAAQAAVLGAAGAAGLTHRGAKQRVVQQAGRALNLARAEESIQQASREAFRLAKQGLQALLLELRREGYVLRGCGLLIGSGRVPAQLAATLASHIAIHTAEGELFRNALAHAAEDRGLRVMRIPERNLLAQASVTLSLSAEDLQTQVTELGKALGPPWREDEKLPTLAAWLVLADLTRQIEQS